MSEKPSGPSIEVHRRIRRMIAEIVEDLGADAVVIGVTRQRKRQTETFAIPFGNLHAVRGVAEFIYGTLADEDDEDDLEDDIESEEVADE
jgi:hypothetical protein